MSVRERERERERERWSLVTRECRVLCVVAASFLKKKTMTKETHKNEKSLSKASFSRIVLNI